MSLVVGFYPVMLESLVVEATDFGLVLLVVGWGDIRTTQWNALPMLVWVGIFYVAIFASAMTFVLLQFASLHLPAAKVMAYTYLTPSWVIVWQVALGNPAPTGLILVGIVLTVLALVLLLEDAAKPVRSAKA